MASWQASTQYPQGSVVSRASAPSSVAVAIPNAGFESGAVSWNFGGNIVIDATFRYQGTNSLRVNGTGTLYPQISTALACVAGQSITASCMYHQGGASAGVNKGRVCLIWYTSGLVEISKSFASSYITSSNGGWKQSTVTAVAPANAAFVKIGAESVKGDAGNPHRFDNFVWNLTSTGVDTGLVFKAVQSGTGTSAATEPTWPVLLGNTVVDGSVTWEAITASSVTWTASPDIVSGGTEPIWVTGVGNFTLDGTMQWEAISRIVDDPKCPQSTVVAIGASKIFAGDEDITPFCATVNPLDWTSARDAGYLPTGLQQAGSNSITVLNLYRQNLVAMNANCFQMWQIDPNPENMTLVDQMQGIGSTYQQAAQEVADELFFMSAQGIRTIGISASSESLQSGDVGSPVDSLIVASIEAAEANGYVPRSTYYTGAGQYWITGNVTGGGEESIQQEVFVYTQNRIGRIGSWSRYIFPYIIDGFTTLGNKLYIRGNNGTDDCIYEMDESLATDDGVPVNGLIQWPWLDFGETSVTKMLESINIVGLGTPPLVSVAYDQRNPSYATTPYQLEADTMTGMEIAIPVSAPTMSMILTYPTGGWELQQFNAYVVDMGRGR